MPFLKLPQTQIHYEVIPNVLPQDTLFLHGNLASNVWWEPTLDILKRRKGDEGSAILMEWRGCGATAHPKSMDEFQMETLANDAVSLLDHLQKPQFNVVGHSTGGLIALYALVKRPEKFRRAVLLDPVSAYGVQLSEEILKAFETMASNHELTTKIMADAIRGVDTRSTLFQRIAKSAMSVSPLIWRGVPQNLTQIHIAPDLKSLEHPILILHGAHDAICPPSGSEQTVQLLRQGTLKMLKDQGHSCNVENPELFTRELVSFL